VSSREEEEAPRNWIALKPGIPARTGKMPVSPIMIINYHWDAGTGNCTGTLAEELEGY
jgi:hypothetical protein